MKNLSRRSMLWVTLVIVFGMLSGIVLHPGLDVSGQGASQSSIFGRGTIKALTLSKDGKRLAVASTVGVWVYNAASLTDAPKFYGTDFQAATAAFSPDGKL